MNNIAFNLFGSTASH